MASQSYHKSLIHSTNNPKTTTQKLLLFTLSIITIVSLAYLGVVTIKSFNFNFTKTLSICDNSHDLTSCLALINEAISPSGIETVSFRSNDDRKMLGKILLEHSLDINKVIHATKRSNDVHMKGAQEINDCLDLMDLSRDRVFDAIKLLANKNNKNNDIKIDINIRTWLSGVLTNHVTCLDQIQNESHLLGLKGKVEDLISSGRALLAIHAKVCGANNLNGGDNVGQKIWNGLNYPSWVRRSDRKLLGVKGSDVAADVVVAKDGSGNFTKVAEAVASAPDKGKKRYVIYVKEGVYEENVEVGKKKKNVMLVGDGMNLTVITGSENVADGNTTFKSATLGGLLCAWVLELLGRAGVFFGPLLVVACYVIWVVLSFLVCRGLFCFRWCGGSVWIGGGGLILIMYLRFKSSNKYASLRLGVLSQPSWTFFAPLWEYILGMLRVSCPSFIVVIYMIISYTMMGVLSLESWLIMKVNSTSTCMALVLRLCSVWVCFVFGMLSTTIVARSLVEEHGPTQSNWLRFFSVYNSFGCRVRSPRCRSVYSIRGELCFASPLKFLRFYSVSMSCSCHPLLQKLRWPQVDISAIFTVEDNARAQLSVLHLPVLATECSSDIVVVIVTFDYVCGLCCICVAIVIPDFIGQEPLL